MCIYACVYVFVHLCVYTRVYVYVFLCIYCGSWYQCFSVWTVSCMRMCFRVHMHAYTYVCRYIYMCIFFGGECYMHFTGVVGTSAWAGVYVTQVSFYTNVLICDSRCRWCTYVYMYICVYMYVYAYGCVCASMILLDTLRPHTCTLCPMFSLDPFVVGPVPLCTCWRKDTITRLCASHTCVT